MTALFENCVLWLANAAWARLSNPHYALIDGMNPLPEGVIREFLKAVPGSTQETPGFVLLPPIESRVPLLHLCHGTEHGEDMIRLTLVIMGTHDDERVATAWRFEAPEGPGAHCYWHCQPVRQLRVGGVASPLEGLPVWLFDDMPTVPVPASCPDELLVALLVAAYGHSALLRMQREGFSDQLHDQLAKLAHA